MLLRMVWMLLANVIATGMNEFTPLANDEPSGSDYVAF